MNIHRLLAGTLALVLVAGFGTPAFADEDGVLVNEEINPSNLAVPLFADDDEIFNNGEPMNTVVFFADTFVPADDFNVTEDTILTDMHFWTQESGPWDGTLEYFIFLDESGDPGELIASGNGTNVEKEDTGFDGFSGDRFVYWFDFEDPIPLEAGEIYWVGLHLDSDFDPPGSVIDWEGTCAFCGGNAANSMGGTFDNWNHPLESELAFILTGHPPIVAGELLPIDSTALFLAGLSANAVWMIPTVLGLAGAGVIIRAKLHRD